MAEAAAVEGAQVRTIVRRRRLRWGRKAALASIALGAVGGFLALSRTIGWGRTPANEIDRVVVETLGRLRTPIVDSVGRSITFLGSVSGVTLLSVSALYVLRRKPRSMLQVIAGAAGGIIAELWVKGFFDRSRPTLLVYLGVHWPTDVLGGFALGTAWACGVEAAFDFEKAHDLEQQKEKESQTRETAIPANAE